MTSAATSRRRRRFYCSAAGTWNTQRKRMNGRQRCVCVTEIFQVSDIHTEEASLKRNILDKCLVISQEGAKAVKRKREAAGQASGYQDTSHYGRTCRLNGTCCHVALLKWCALAAAPMKVVSNTATDKLINENSFQLIVKAAIIEIRRRKKWDEGPMIEPSVFHLSGREHKEARHGEAWTSDFFFFFSRAIFSMMPNCFLPLLRCSQLPLHLASAAAGKRFPARQRRQKSKIVCLVVSTAISEHL